MAAIYRRDFIRLAGGGVLAGGPARGRCDFAARRPGSLEPNDRPLVSPDHGEPGDLHRVVGAGLALQPQRRVGQACIFLSCGMLALHRRPARRRVASPERPSLRYGSPAVLVTQGKSANSPWVQGSNSADLGHKWPDPAPLRSSALQRRAATPAARSGWRTDDADSMWARNTHTIPPHRCRILRLQALAQQPSRSVSFLRLRASSYTNG